MAIRSLARRAFPVLLSLGGVAGVVPLAAGAQAAPAGFLDPERVQKLSSAFPDIDRIFREFTEREHVPGAIWGIVIDGALAHVGTTGFRDLETQAPVEPTTVFRIASMTKSFTAAAILALRDQGRLSLDDPAERWVPELAGLDYPTTDAPRITIRHLLSHATGFPEDNPWGDQQLAVTDDEMSAMMRAGIPFSNAPGVAYEYSNYGFAILGRIVTAASGMPYRRYLQEAVLEPLGLSSTTLEPGDVDPSRIAQGYRWEDERWKLEPQLPDGAFGSMGGMLTSMQDLSVWVAQFLEAFPPHDGPETGPLRRASLREMQQVQRPRPAAIVRGADGSPQLSSGGYGYGLGISTTCEFAHVVAHSGGLPGFGSVMRWLPEHGVGVLAFGNRTYTSWGGPADQALARLRETGGLEPRMPAPSEALVAQRDAVTDLVLHWDDAAAQRLAAVNLFLDRSADRRRAEIEALLEKVGPCESGEGFDEVENALRGSWTLPCARGALSVSITLAPTAPPLVQFLRVTEAGPLERSRCRY